MGFNSGLKGLISVLEVGEWSTSVPGRFNPGRRRGVLSVTVLRKVLCGCQNWSGYAKGKGKVYPRTGNAVPEGE
jgi:hypothetical protein